LTALESLEVSIKNSIHVVKQVAGDQGHDFKLMLMLMLHYLELQCQAYDPMQMR